MKVAIIGGGPAGMMAAVTSAKNGNSVYLFEKNAKLGKKLYITGKGRCNLTNECAPNVFLQNVVSNPRFLNSCVHCFSPVDTISYFEGLGLALKTERGSRVFPVSDRAVDVTIAFEKELKAQRVKVLFNQIIKNVNKNNLGFVLTKNDGSTEIFDAVILATGGKSYPATGSTGDGYTIATAFGHSIVPPVTALAPILVSYACEKRLSNLPPLEGLSLKNINLSLFYSKKLMFTEQGEMMFTANGISGPLTFTLSSLINRMDLSRSELVLDLKPALTLEELDARILRDFAAQPNKMLRNALDDLLPQKIIPFILGLLPFNDDVKVSSLTKIQRKALTTLLKSIKFTGLELSPIEVGVVTAGGINTKEINPSTMESKIIKGLYFAGEVIDVDALTGGFNIQIALSTGYLAGKSIKENNV